MKSPISKKKLGYMNVLGQILLEWKYEDCFLKIPKFPQYNYTTCSVLSARLALLENVEF